MNNLAVNLATRQGKPDQALPFAERAATIMKTDPNYLDTLAWTQHLLGADKLAAITIRSARAFGGADPEIIWHAAVIFAGAGDVSRAASELKESLAADPSLAERPEIKKLQEQLNGAK